MDDWCAGVENQKETAMKQKPRGGRPSGLLHVDLNPLHFTPSSLGITTGRECDFGPRYLLPVPSENSVLIERVDLINVGLVGYPIPCRPRLVK